MLGRIHDVKKRGVIANTSLDFDSFASATAFAEFTGGIPYFPIPKDELRFRRDVTTAIEYLRIPMDHFLFKENTSLLSFEEILLVDHNALPPKEAEHKAKVITIIDHHKEDDDSPDIADKTIEVCASCSTLIAERILTKRGEMSPIASILLAAAIDLDTDFLTNSRVTEKDMNIRRLLSPSLSTDDERFIRRLSYEKNNISGFSFRDLLIRDSKKITANRYLFLFSSVPVSPEELFAGESDNPDHALTYMKEQRGNALFITHHRSKTRERWLSLIVPPESPLRTPLIDYLKESSLKLSFLLSPASFLISFKQGEANATRKVILPLVRDFLKKHHNDKLK